MFKPLALLILYGALPAVAGNIEASFRYAYDANAGWIDFSPPVPDNLTVGNYFLKGFAYSANYGWVNFGSGPANNLAYTGIGSDQGVNATSGTGALSGYAYSANTGWINFGWAAFNDPNRARYTVNSGTFFGYVYSQNTGWINISTAKSANLAISDSDGDNIDDAWEITFFGNLTGAGVGTDFDKDGQTDAADFTAGTLPKDNTSWMRITLFSVDSGKTQNTLNFPSTNTRLYQIWTSTTLSPGSWVIAPTTGTGTAEFPGGGGTSSVTCVQPANTIRFFRVSVRKF